MSNIQDRGGSRFTGGGTFWLPRLFRRWTKAFSDTQRCHLQLTFSTAAVVTRPGGMCFLDRIKKQQQWSSASERKTSCRFESSSPPSDVRVQLKVTTTGLVHGTLCAVIYCASSHRLACTDGRSNTHKHNASGKPWSPHLPPPPLRSLKVLPVFKSSLRPLSVDKSNG